MRIHNVSRSFRIQTHPLRWSRPVFGYSTPSVEAGNNTYLILFHSLIHPSSKAVLIRNNSKHWTDERKKGRSFGAVVWKHIVRGTLRRWCRYWLVMRGRNFSWCWKMRGNSMAFEAVQLGGQAKIEVDESEKWGCLPWGPKDREWTKAKWEKRH